MPEEQDGPGEEKRKFGAPAWLWAKAKYYAIKYVDGLILAGIAAVVTWGLALFFRPPVTVVLDQSSLGNHCAKQIFAAAEADGVRLKIDEPTRQMTICGKGIYETGRVEDSLRHYLTEVYPQCFTTTVSSDGAFEIKPNLAADGGKATPTALGNGGTLTFCRCLDEQIPLSLRENTMVCGVDLR